MIWIVPFAICLCLAAVQAMRRNWKNSLIWLLASFLFLQWVALAGQIHTQRVTQVAIRTRIMRLEKEIETLKEWIESETGKEPPNQAVLPIAASTAQADR